MQVHGWSDLAKSTGDIVESMVGDKHDAGMARKRKKHSIGPIGRV
jgi:hypothetical protein